MSELQINEPSFLKVKKTAATAFKIALSEMEKYPTVKSPKDEKEVQEILRFVHKHYKEYNAERMSITRMLDAQKKKLIEPENMMDKFLKDGKSLLDEFTNAQKFIADLEAYKISFPETLNLYVREQAIKDKEVGKKSVPDILKLMQKPTDNRFFDAYKELCNEYATKIRTIYLEHHAKVDVNKVETLLDTAKLKEDVQAAKDLMLAKTVAMKPKNAVTVKVVQINTTIAYYQLFEMYVKSKGFDALSQDKNLDFLSSFAKKLLHEDAKKVEGLEFTEEVKNRL